jgi:hypothetical protein
MPRDEVKLALVTPVHLRHELTELCLRQRADQLKDFPVEVVQIVIGDDPVHRAVARRLGLEWVECSNEGDMVGRKFNAGYARAAELGCTHAMAVGSDSFLHPDALAGVDFGPAFATAITGLSCFREDGLERVDVFVRYPAGYGVGMVYPVPALSAVRGGPCNPELKRGCDSSTWSRAGSGLGVRYKKQSEPLHYVNFCSPEVQLTGYVRVKNVHASRRRAGTVVSGVHVFEDLSEAYGEHGEAVAGLYAARALGAFLTGKSTNELKAERLELVRVRRSANQARALARRPARVRARTERDGSFIATQRVDR